MNATTTTTTTFSSKLVAIVEKHLKVDHFIIESKPPSDRLLTGLIFPSETQNRLHLARQIGRIWLDVFELFGWTLIKGNSAPRQVSLVGTRDSRVAIIVQNNWKTSNFDSKQSKFKTLKDYKRLNPETHVIFGCINDFKIRDYYNCDDIHVLTSDAFLDYMLGSNWRSVVETLREGVGKFVLENNLATLR